MTLEREAPPPESDCSDQHRAILTAPPADELRRRRLYRRLPTGPRCTLCNAPFAGFGGALMRMRGRRPFPKNPNLCEACFEDMDPGGCEIAIGVLFVDMRGSTALAERLGATAYTGVLNRYYHEVTTEMIASEAFIEITGDEVYGFFMPGWTRGEVARVAIETAERILRRVDEVGVGAGVHIGPAWVGVVGDPVKVKEFRSVGDAVNVGARLVSKAGAGECLISEEAYAQAGMEWANLEMRSLEVKGKSAPLRVRAMRIRGPA